MAFTTLSQGLGSQPKLQPCPFCGGNASLVFRQSDDRVQNHWRVGCQTCNVGFSAYGGAPYDFDKATDKDDAAKALIATKWNTRHAA